MVLQVLKQQGWDWRDHRILSFLKFYDQFILAFIKLSIFFHILILNCKKCIHCALAISNSLSTCFYFLHFCMFVCVTLSQLFSRRPFEHFLNVEVLSKEHLCLLSLGQVINWHDPLGGGSYLKTGQVQDPVFNLLSITRLKPHWPSPLKPGFCTSSLESAMPVLESGCLHQKDIARPLTAPKIPIDVADREKMMEIMRNLILA